MSNNNERKYSEVTLYFGLKTAITILEWEGNPHRAIESLELQIGKIDHWHFN